MTCRHKKSVLEKCYGCGRTKKVYKCKKIDLVIGRFTCSRCKYYEKRVVVNNENGKWIKNI